MKRSLLMLLLLQVFFLILLFSSAASGQVTRTESSETERRRLQEEREGRNMRLEEIERRREMSKDHGRAIQSSPPQFYRLSSADKKLMTPSAEDQTAHAEFLRQSGTGICKLLSGPENINIINAEEMSEDRSRGIVKILGSRYSFTHSKNGYDKWSEIRLRGNMLEAGFTGESLGLLTALGDVPLDSVTLSMVGASDLANFSPPENYSDALKQYERNTRGFQKGGLLYRSTLPALLNTTYVLRSTSYKRADSLVAFRVIRQDELGNLTILWKRLKSYPVRSLKGEPKGAFNRT